MDDDRRVIDPGVVAIREDRVAAVGPAEDAVGWAAARTMDCRGRAVLPGLVDCHTHLFQSLAKGIGDGLALWPWLREVMWPYGAALSGGDAQAAAYLGAVQAVAGGTTALLDHHGGPTDLEAVLAQARAIEEVGLRGVVGRTIRGPRPVPGAQVGVPTSLSRSSEEELEITRAAIDARPPGGRLTVWPAPANPVHVAPETFLAAVELADVMGTGWHTHCSEDRTDPDRFREAYGRRPVEWMSEEGLLDGHATLAHAIWLDEGEIELVGATSTGVSHNPVSNAYLGAGLMPLRRLRGAGAVVGLGTDGPAVAGMGILECVKQAVLLQRLDALDPEAVSARAALELATREGARYLGIDSGVVEPGKLADLVVLDLRSAHATPVHDPAAAAVYMANARDVEATIVGGRVVYEAGRCMLVDQDEIVAEAQVRAASVAERLGWR